MASIKVHVFRGDDDGTTSCDFRGDKWIGKLDDPRNVSQVEDFHRTVDKLEIDPASEDLVSKVLRLGPAANELFSALRETQPDALADIASALGLEGDGPVGLRVGVWDN